MKGVCVILNTRKIIDLGEVQTRTQNQYAETEYLEIEQNLQMVHRI